MDEDEEIDVDDLFDNELEAASQSAEFDDYAQADDGNAVDDRGIAEERRTARMHNEWEEIRSKEMLKSVWEKSKKQNSGEPVRRDSGAGGANGQHSKGKPPRPKLTERELTGERGLSALRDSFVDFEVESTLGPFANMNRLLDRMENWAHCLYPLLAFDDFLEKVEVLGKKRLTKYALNNIRLGVVAEADTEQIGSGRLIYEKVWDDDGDDGDGQPVKNKQGEEFFDDFYVDDDYPAGHTSSAKDNPTPEAPAQRASPAIDEDSWEERGGKESEQNSSANPLFTPMNSDDEGERMEIWSRGQQGTTTTTKEDFSFIPASANRQKAYSTHPRRRAIISDDEESFDENELIMDIELDEDGDQT